MKREEVVDTAGNYSTPFFVVPFLTVNDASHQGRIAEHRHDEIPIQPSICSAMKNLMYDVVYDTVKKVVPRELEEQALHWMSEYVRLTFGNAYQNVGDDVGFEKSLLQAFSTRQIFREYAFSPAGTAKATPRV
jgi:hypothetical protein